MKRIKQPRQRVSTNFLRKFLKPSKSLEEGVFELNGPSHCDMQNIPLNVETPQSNHVNEVIPNEIILLRQQVTELTERMKILENENLMKGANLEKVNKDNEQLTLEIKKQQRCNRNLKQQLDDERFFYQKEKDYFSQEMENHRVKCAGSTSKLHLQQYKELKRIREALEEENKDMREELIEKSKITYNLCIKFLRMKDAKDTLREKLDSLLRDHLHVMAEMMEKLDEAREELNIIVSEKFHDPLPLSKAKFLQVVQRNSRLVYENAALKVHIQQLTQNIEKLKSQMQKPKTIDVDTRTIEKLSASSDRRRSEEFKDSLKITCEHQWAEYLEGSKSPTKFDRTRSAPGVVQKFHKKHTSNSKRAILLRDESTNT